MLLFIENRFWNLSFYVCLLLLIAFILQVFCFTSFKIPSDSMVPTLYVGDKILVNKFLMGARLFNVFASLKNEQVDIYRMPGVRNVERNDVVVFNFPYKKGRKDSIRMDVMQYYVKRCIALPGDTLEIRNGIFKIRGVDEKLGNIEAQRMIFQLTDAEKKRVGMRAFPRDKKMGWTILEFGPLAVPARGQKVVLTRESGLLYKQLISWEQKKRLTINEDTIMLGDSIITEYCFLKNYYFVAGDKAENSQDSRYWGMLPEEYIVGIATWVWYSEKGKARRITDNNCQ
jgi:signal peptidase I